MQAKFYLLGRSAESISISLITIWIYYIFLPDLLALISMLPVFAGRSDVPSNAPAGFFISIIIDAFP